MWLQDTPVNAVFVLEDPVGISLGRFVYYIRAQEMLYRSDMWAA